ncbi:uncharacterized protein PFL1_00359 [Pseudozyma flocculosa PF-1]|uniref:sn-1-specific diacylglycerol lipase n=1 Tax=Pseudozyma flocculosa TaxID=84751 RepID=A0A5C3ERP2_9BASI|nr:uncharacterized protein PFL1_00359 [Pseudozyma flocculosa PF-1]EPQ32162.1 hypothetical protein PFL1_00359 [Pseudozyma flocculosa PF-1]SPO34898.1 uncharacterized protein PSFLO_00369 [Pseudozyma flocculosa]
MSVPEAADDRGTTAAAAIPDHATALEQERDAAAQAQEGELESLQEAALAIPDSDTAAAAAIATAATATVPAPADTDDDSAPADQAASPSSSSLAPAQEGNESSPDPITTETQGHPGSVMLANPGTVVQAPASSMDWSTLLGYSSQGLGAANSASSTGFAFARGATAFGLNLAKRITQGLVALPAMAVDGALTGTVPGSNDGTPSLAKVAHMTVGGFFDAISMVALGGIDVTSAITGAGLGAAGTGVEGLRRWMGSEVLRSLSEFSKLVKREWNADDDALPPGGIPAYSIIGITQALTAWVCIQLVTRDYQERRMLKSMIEIDLNEMEVQLKEAQKEELARKEATQPTPSVVGAVTDGGADSSNSEPAREPESDRDSVRITSKEMMSGQEGNIIGAEIGSKQQEGTSTFAVPHSSTARPLTNLEALRGLQRYSKLVLGVYGGLALAWLGTLPAEQQAASGAVEARNRPDGPTTIFSAEEEFLSRDQADFLEAAASMDLPEESDAEESACGRMPGAMISPSPTPSIATPASRPAQLEVSPSPASGQSSTRPQGTAYSYLDIISGQHDNDLFHRTANLEKGAAQEGSYDEHVPRADPGGKARPSKPRFYVVTDHPRKVIILVLRGSLSMGDFAADLTCESVPFTFHPSVGDVAESTNETGAPAGHGHSEDFCHEGMLITAKEIGDVGRPVNRAVASALTRNGGYSLEIAGHSLGAGVASILAMMWGNPTTGLTIAESGLPAGRRIHSYCYAVPCVASESLARKCAALVTSHVYSYDFVTRLSLGAIQDIRNGCAWLCYEDAEASRQQVDRPQGKGAGPKKMSSLMRKAFEHQAGRLDSSETGEKAEVEADFLSLRKTLEANMHGTHLFPPGKVLYSLPSSDLNGHDGAALSPPRIDRDRLFSIDDRPGSLKNVFGQIIFSRTMLSCHMPSKYDQALHRLPH